MASTLLLDLLNLGQMENKSLKLNLSFFDLHNLIQNIWSCSLPNKSKSKVVRRKKNEEYFMSYVITVKDYGMRIPAD